MVLELLALGLESDLMISENVPRSVTPAEAGVQNVLK